jgi:hypothetical protein
MKNPVTIKKVNGRLVVRLRGGRREKTIPDKKKTYNRHDKGWKREAL